MFRMAVMIAAMLALGLIWKSQPAPRTYASLHNQPQRNEAGEVTTMQRAFEEIVARRDVAIPIEKQKEIATLFHDLSVWRNMWFLGIPIQKNPCDLWMMQQIIYETKPDLIVETGTFRGGSALYLAQALSSAGLDNSKIITVDIEDARKEAAEIPLWKKHVEFILGSSTAPETARRIREAAKGKRVLVVLDSKHEKDHVLAELELYASLVGPGSYVIVEDTNSDGVPLFPGVLGPTAAVQAFLETEEGKHFRQDVSREAMVLTFNPGGWLKRND